MAEIVPKERDEDSGQYTEVVSDEEIVEYLREACGAGTVEVAEQFGYKRPTAYRRLKDLEGRGEVGAREVGNSILWLPDPGAETDGGLSVEAAAGAYRRAQDGRPH